VNFSSNQVFLPSREVVRYGEIMDALRIRHKKARKKKHTFDAFSCSAMWNFIGAVAISTSGVKLLESTQF